MDRREAEYIEENELSTEERAEPDPHNDPANRQAGCQGGSWCRCAVSTPCDYPEPRSVAPDAYTRTGVYLGEQRDV